MNDRNTIQGILVTLDIGGEPSLFIMLASDGTINRMGTGMVDNAERDLFIGKVGPGLFEQLRARVTPELLGWCGQRLADPQPQGAVCDLSIGFQQADGQERVTGWRYGSQSQGPPPEVCQFVRDAVEATDSWFEQQKAMVRRGGAG
jgi:hypothetical protein